MVYFVTYRGGRAVAVPPFSENVIRRITGMKKVCDLCGWEYNEEEGYPEGGIEPGTKWEEVAWHRLSNHDMYPEKIDNR